MYCSAALRNESYGCSLFADGSGYGDFDMAVHSKRRHQNFGMDRLLNSLNEDTSLEGDGIIGKLWDDISQFQNGCNQADDVTMLLLEV